jgi:hypothetical protein
VIHRGFRAGVMCVTLATASLALSEPSIRLGGRVTSMNCTFYNGFADPLGEVTRITHMDAYKGIGIEAVYGPIGWAYGRVELASVRFFSAGGGALVGFPAAGLDVLVEPQFHWRVVPYVWGGGSYTGYWGKQNNADPRFGQIGKLNSLYELRAGVGVEYRLSRRVNLFAEFQTLVDMSVLAPSAVRDFPQLWEFSGFGPMARADVGFRYDFGAR